MKFLNVHDKHSGPSGRTVNDRPHLGQIIGVKRWESCQGGALTGLPACRMPRMTLSFGSLETGYPEDERVQLVMN